MAHLHYVEGFARTEYAVTLARDSKRHLAFGRCAPFSVAKAHKPSNDHAIKTRLIPSRDSAALWQQHFTPRIQSASRRYAHPRNLSP